MHLGTTKLLEFFRKHQEADSMVVVTIIETEGSTYRKAGAMMLVSPDLSFEGMISGGCLEGDLLQHAAEVFSTGKPKFVTYDMHANDELVWGLGLGCDGVVHLLLQCVARSQQFGFLSGIDQSMKSRQPILVAIKTSKSGPLAVGSFATLNACWEKTGEKVISEALGHFVNGSWPKFRFTQSALGKSGECGEFLIVNIPPQTCVLVCGAGPDAVPLVQLISQLGWKSIVVDHRPNYAKNERFPLGSTVIQSRPEHLKKAVNLDDVDAVVIMSHNLEHDGTYLSQVSDSKINYLGILGPGTRRARLFEMSDCSDRKVFGPVGLDIGAELPESIALSIASEIHAILNEKIGCSLTEHDHINFKETRDENSL